MRIEYFPTDDMLYLTLAPIDSLEGSEVTEGFVFYYDDKDRVVGIEVSDASERVNLSAIETDPKNIIEDTEGVQEVFTVRMLADEWGVQPRTLQKTIQAMADASIEVGESQGPTYPTILSGADVEKIKQWRQAHPPGRRSKEKKPEVEQV